MSKITLVSNTEPLIALPKIGCLKSATELYQIFVAVIAMREWRSAPKI